ncbi:hypothetical protein HBB16_15100 [Pseudonocardia sp. MCCB 268]|nr:hypothetical protein [Pseudonocardia cytotoxica]
MLITNAAAGGLGLDRLDRNGTRCVPAGRTVRRSACPTTSPRGSGWSVPPGRPRARCSRSAGRRPRPPPCAARRSRSLVGGDHPGRRPRRGGPVLVRGEAGTGKTTVLADALGPSTVLDAATHGVDGAAAWTGRLRDAVRRWPAGATARGLLDPAAALAVAAVLTGPAARPPLEAHRRPRRWVPGRPSRYSATPSAPPVAAGPAQPARLTSSGFPGGAPEGPGRRARDSPRTLAVLRRHRWPEQPRRAHPGGRRRHRGRRPARGDGGGATADVRAAATRRTLTPSNGPRPRSSRPRCGHTGTAKSTAARARHLRTALYSKIRSYRI